MNYTPYGQFAPAFPQQQAQQQAFACRPVASREEAVAVQTDYFSAGTVMPDIGHGVVYMKRFNPTTGASDFYTFVLQKEMAASPAPVYATAQEVAELRAEIEKLREVKQNAE